jgi:Xaa-Pro aminopeptidase
LDAVVCAAPLHVLLLTGYWPVVGTALAIATADGRQVVIAPADERELAAQGWAEVRTYQPGGLDALRTAYDAVQSPLTDALRELGVARRRLGYERGPVSEPATYSAQTLWGASLPELLADCAPAAHMAPADDVLAELRARKTPREVANIRRACELAEAAFRRGAAGLRSGERETEAAARFRAPLDDVADDERAVGFAWCMSGPHAAQAGGAYASSRARPLARGEPLLVHCNSAVNGYWTDITRTYCLGAPDERLHDIYAAIFAARAAALAAAQPGASARDVDAAARAVLTERGYGAAFTHGTGHGVGFGAIEHAAVPRIHPCSDDVLEPGMVCNIEPAVYLAGWGGVRHCDMLAITADGAELLTPFQASVEELVLEDG